MEAMFPARIILPDSSQARRVATWANSASQVADVVSIGFLEPNIYFPIGTRVAL